jgi:hypothetical protein
MESTETKNDTPLELFGYWDEKYNCFVQHEVAINLINLDSPLIKFVPLYRKVKDG